MPGDAPVDSSDAAGAPLSIELAHLSVKTLELRSDALKESCRMALGTGEYWHLASTLEENIAFQSALLRAIRGSHKTCDEPDDKDKH